MYRREGSKPERSISFGNNFVKVASTQIASAGCPVIDRGECVEHAHTTDTPTRTSSTESTTPRVNLLLSQKASTKQVQGMIHNFEICNVNSSMEIIIEIQRPIRFMKS